MRVLQAVPYGPDPAQAGDLHLPDSENPPVVCLLHGGFWRMPHARDQMTPLAEDLARRGYAAWNLGYRRLGADGGGWPGTFADVAAGIDHLATLAAEGIGLDLTRVAAVGHSAGGQLALWSAGRHRIAAKHPWAQPRVRVGAAVGQAAASDLVRVHELALSNGVVAQLLGGSPADVPKRYAAASPRALLPLGVPQLIVHGSADDAVPIEIAHSYVAAARAAGDRVDLIEDAAFGHFDHLDRDGAAWAAVVRWLDRELGLAAKSLPPIANDIATIRRDAESLSPTKSVLWERL